METRWSFSPSQSLEGSAPDLLLFSLIPPRCPGEYLGAPHGILPVLEGGSKSLQNPDPWRHPPQGGHVWPWWGVMGATEKGELRPTRSGPPLGPRLWEAKLGLGFERKEEKGAFGD